MKNVTGLALVLTAALPLAAVAQQNTAAQYGPVVGDREFSIAGTGTNDRNFDNGNFGFVGDYGWYQRENLIFGIRQSVNYANIEDENITNDFWNGSSRGYLDYQFGQGRMRPFVGGSLGVIYGDGVRNSGFGGVELGGKYYVLPKTYLLGRADYQWFFNRSSDASDAFRNGAWALTLGVGFNF